ncbi:thiamine diphosphokinase [Malassezia caprae]|uniref:Thiamine diphosphokinase n=1 Tax=Malassezia caprae TaxID=1381934 RepID=A0AAF0E8B4_9BASI|nr:thiamine diphosphokinase [Malassezia caprae]
MPRYGCLREVAHACQNDDPWADASLYAFLCDGVQIGFVTAPVWEVLREHGAAQAWPLVLQSAQRAVTFADACSSVEQRTRAMNEVAVWMRDHRMFPDPLDGWRNEQYAIYGPGERARIAFTLERAACALFGLATFGVHLTAHTPDGRIWVPKRSSTKSTWPGFYDNSVAGGITAGDGPLATVVRECEEEAGLPPPLVRERVQAAGVLTYFYKTERGWRQPEMQYVYDLLLPPDVVLAPSDGEAESFEPLDRTTILERMLQGTFKPNCTLVLLDFFIRHGWLTAESERDYAALVSLLHTPLRIPVP